MVKVVFTADTHLGLDQPARVQAPHRRGPDFFANFDRVLDYAVTHRADLVLHGGDLFYRSRVPPRIVDMVYRRLGEFAAHGIPMGIIAGNHERSALPPSLFLQHPNIHVFHRPSTHVFPTRNGRVAVTGIPFVRDVRGLPTLTASLRPEEAVDVRLLLLHQAIEGATVGPANYTFRAGDDVIPRSALPDGFHAYLSGHIHRRQVLWRVDAAGKRIPIIYPGSIERTSFAEREETKGFIVLTLGPEGGNIHFEPLPARPMLEVTLEGVRSPTHLVELLRGRLDGVDPRTILRLRVPEHALPWCTRKNLRGVLAPAMPVTLRAITATSPDEDEASHVPDSPAE
ncbi:MAG: DNA repair exonuclease [Myxococcota bacterium]